MVDLWLETIVAEVILNVAEVILDVAEVILSFHEINGFPSLQLGLSFELGFRLRLTNIFFLSRQSSIFQKIYLIYFGTEKVFFAKLYWHLVNKTTINAIMISLTF